MSLSHPSCPSCGGDLTLTHSGSLDTWVCPAGHGLAMTLTESDGRLQEDEISSLWQRARAAVPTGAGRPSPTTGTPMVSIEVPYDDDEAVDGAPGDGPDRGSVWLDVDVSDQVIWFDASELESLPEDLADPEPSPESIAALAKIRETFGTALVDAAATRDDADVAERIYRRIATHPGLTHALTEVGSLGRR